MAIKDIDIIWFSLDRANNKYSSTSISLAKELAKTNRVFFVDNPRTQSEVIKSFFRTNNSPYNTAHNLVGSKVSNLLIESPPGTLSINWLPPGFVYRQLLSYNNKLVFEFIGQLIKQYCIQRYIFVNVFNPFYYELNRLPFLPDMSMYYSVDEISLSPYLSKHGPRLEQEITDKYDVVLTTSKQLYLKFKSLKDKSYYLPNGADLRLFSSKTNEIPEEFRNLDKPVVIYTGHIDWRMDIQLITEVILRNQDIFFLFVGPVSLASDIFERLRSYKNVIFPGSKHIDDLPSYVHHSSCAIIPFKRNDLTRSIYPLKINEYLATGTPVVSTPFSEDIEQFSDVIALAQTADEFHEMIHEAIQNNTVDKTLNRIKRAEENTWSRRVDEFWQIVEMESSS